MSFPQWRTQFRLQHALVLLADRTPVTTHRAGLRLVQPERVHRGVSSRVRQHPGRFFTS